MEPTRLRQCLDRDYGRLHDVVAVADPAAPVPSCPEWTVADLARHTAEVYLHKVACTRLGRSPEEWPPDLSDMSPVAALEHACTELTQMFDTHEPSHHSATWYDGDQTVGFWIRRMAQETVIHRRDAELAVGEPTPAAPDLAIDGIAELLDLFVEYPTKKWAAECKDVLEPADGDTVLVEADGSRWVAEIRTSGVDVSRPQDAPSATVRVSGGPSAVLFWLWNRWDPSDGAVAVDGDPAAVDRLRALLTLSTQ